MFSRWNITEHHDGWGIVYYADEAPEFYSQRYKTKEEANRALKNIKQYDKKNSLLSWWGIAAFCFAVGLVGSILNISRNTIFAIIVIVFFIGMIVDHVFKQ